jgi:hypothetical protein
LAGAVGGDAMSDFVEAAEFLDVEMDHLAGMGALVTAHRLGRLERLQGVEAQAAQDADCGRRDADFGGDLPAGVALAE